MWIGNPLREQGFGIRNFPGNVAATTEIMQWWARRSSRQRDAGNRMTSAALKAIQREATAFDIAGIHRCDGLFAGLAIASRTDDDGSRKRATAYPR